MKSILGNLDPRSWRSLRISLLGLCVVASTFVTLAEGIQFGRDVTVQFLKVEPAREVLTRHDEFIAALTPLDRRARLKTERDVSEKDFLTFVSRSVQPWTSEDTNRIAKAFQSVEASLARWRLPFPTNILVIKTSGEEEFNNAYTRQNAIIFPASEAAGRPSALKYLIVHELFHVLSRHDPELRRALYEVIGFRPINEIELPQDILARKITNPDGVANGWIIGLTNQSEFVQTAPILLATGPTFNPNQGGANPYDYFRLLVVKKREGTNWMPHLVAGHSRLLKPTETTGWFEQIGRNTRYTIHPDEILADNFFYLMNGNTNMPSSWILSDMADVLRQRQSKN